MPDATNPIEQKLTISLEEKIKGDVGSHLRNVEKALEKTRKRLAKYDKQFQRHAKTIKRALPAVDKYTKQQTRLSKSVSASLTPMRRQLDLLKKTRREMRSTQKVSQGLGRSFGRLAGMLGAGGLLYAAFRRVQDNAAKTLNLAVTGGPNQVTMVREMANQLKINQITALDLAARFQGQSPYNRFALGDSAIKGLLTAQSKMDAIGSDRARDLLLAVTESLEPKQAQAFLNQAATGNVRQALLGAASGQNIQAVTSALNALEIEKQGGKSDPLMQAALAATKSIENLGMAFDKVAEQIVSELAPALTKIAEFVAGLSAKQMIGVGVGVGVGSVVGGLTAWELAKYGLKRGARGVGSLFGRGVPPGVPGVPPAGLGGGPGIRAPGMRPMLPAPVLNRIPLNPLPLPAGGLVGYGLAGGAAAGGVYTAVRSGQTAYAERQALEAIQKSMGDDRLFDLARKIKGGATTELDRLHAKRVNLDAIIATSAPTGDMGIKRDFIGRKLGFYGDFPQSDPKQIDRLREQRAAVQRQIQALRKQQPTSTIVSDVFDSIRSGLDKARSAAERFKAGMDTLADKALQANLRRLQQQAAKREHLAMTATEQGALTQISRLEFDIARTTPFGTIGAMGQFRDLQEQLNREIESLTDVMHNIDVSTQAGRIEAARMNVQIKSLRLEERQRGLEMTKAMMSSITAQAFNAGKFEKIIITQEMNVRKGLAMGVIKAYEPITGVTGRPSRGRKSFRINPATNAIDAVHNMERASRDLAGYLESIIGEDEPSIHTGSDGYGTIN